MPPITETVIGDVEKGVDLVLRVRTLEVDGEEFLDVRDYVPSSDTYGRGVVIPRKQAAGIAKLLRSA